MSLYNMVRGINPNAGLCLMLLGLNTDLLVRSVPRLRDAWLHDDGKRLTVLTRTGGGNREEYTEENDRMRLLDGYVEDKDDDVDSTFAHWVYDINEQFHADTAVIAAMMVHAGSGAATQGPGPMIEALLKATEQQPGAKPTINKQDPAFVKGWAAFQRLSGILRPPPTNEAQ